MNSTLKKILKVSGYTLFGLFIFIFFTYLNFPYNKLKDKAFSLVQLQSGLILDAENLKPTLTFGMNLTDVSISHKNSTLDPIQIPNLSFAPSLISLVTFSPKLKFNAELTSGSISGYFHQKGLTHQAVQVQLNSVNIKSNFSKQLPLDLSGISSGNVIISGDFKQAQSLEGSAEIKIDKLTLGQMTILNMTLPKISVSGLTLLGELKKQRFQIKKFDIGSPKDDIHVTTSGDVTLNVRKIDHSRLNLKLKLKLSDKMKEEFKMFLPFIAAALGKDGYYTLKVSGRLSAPMALPQRS